MKKILSLVLTTVLTTTLLAGCGAKETASNKKADAPLKVGVTAGPHEQLAEKVKEIAKGKGLDIELANRC
jgi:D-methionine transport system substrate-binding protein